MNQRFQVTDEWKWSFISIATLTSLTVPIFELLISFKPLPYTSSEKAIETPKVVVDTKRTADRFRPIETSPKLETPAVVVDKKKTEDSRY